MNLTDTGILLAKKTLHDSSALIKIFSRSYGVYEGFINDSVNNNLTYQVGNFLSFSWKARLTNHLGQFKCEMIKSYFSRIMFCGFRLYSLASAMSLLNYCLNLRQQYIGLFDILVEYCDYLQNDLLNLRELVKYYILFELKVLTDTGYGLDLTKCVVSGATEQLIYVSPKSGRAVSSSAGVAYHNKLLMLPLFIIDTKLPSNFEDIKQGFDLTAYFLQRYLFTNQKSMPRIRHIFVDLVLKSL